MSDLSNEGLLQDEIFNPIDLVKSYCLGTKIELPNYVEIHFLQGWKNIVDSFIQSVRTYPISITQITDLYSVLDIKFEMIKPYKEVYVWRAIDAARNQSKNICANCSRDKGFIRKNNTSEMFCAECIKNAGMNGKTRTWLDKY